jgi:hypothetical protein
MIIVLTIFMILTFFLLLAMGVGAFLAWQKISVFLTWNTRYQEADYEQTITRPKNLHPTLPAKKTVKRGREITPVADLVDLGDMPFEDAFSAVSAIGEGNVGEVKS